MNANTAAPRTTQATVGNLPAAEPLLQTSVHAGNSHARHAAAPASIQANTTILKDPATSRAPAPTQPRQRICWLGGWGIAEADMLAIVQRLLPEAEHRVLPPTAASLAHLHQQLRGTVPASAAEKSDATAVAVSAAISGTDSAILPIAKSGADVSSVTEIIAGYSTGAFLLLRDFADCFSATARRTPLRLFAPFADFRAEGALGGRVVTTRLKLLLRRLRSVPLAAVADFYQQSNIALPPPTALPYAQADLIWGIEQLAETSWSQSTLTFVRDNRIADLRAWVGEGDALLEAGKIATLFPGETCQVVSNATHDLGSLLCVAVGEGGFTP